jgi:hypothetical protein
MPQARGFIAVSTESPAPTGVPSFNYPEPAPTDTPWTWAHDFEAATDPGLQLAGTPLLLLKLHGSFARGIRIKPFAGIDVIVVDVCAHGPTMTAAEEATVSIRPGDDWAAMIRRLLDPPFHELRWLYNQQTSVTSGELVPIVTTNYDLEIERRHTETAEEEEDAGAPAFGAFTRDAIGAGRHLHAGLRAVDDLRRWMSLSVADIARIAGLSESTVYWWAEHPTSIPRPAKIDRLLGLQALAWGLVEDLGEAMTRQWFRAGRPSPLDRLRRDPGALPVVEEQGYKLLQRLANKRLADAGPGRPVTDDDDQRDLARLAEQERDLKEPLVVEELDPRRLEPEDLE